MNPWLQSFLDTFFPNQCIICNTPHEHNLCPNCLTHTPQEPKLLHSPSNTLFRIPLTTQTESLPERSNLKACLVATPFQNTAIRKSIHGFKYKNLPQLSYPLSRILLTTLSHHLIPTSETPILCPIPLHPKRYKFRGYNQTELLGTHLSQDLGFPLYTDLTRVKHTQQQMRNQHRTERLENMKDAFDCQNPAEDSSRPIILIDDVTTTLSTLEESAKALSRAGFINIYALVIAH